MSTQKPETVYVIVTRQADRTTYHTDRDCQYIRNSTVREVEKQVLHDDMRICKECAGAQSRGAPAATTECPLCGEEIRELSSHLPKCPSG